MGLLQDAVDKMNAPPPVPKGWHDSTHWAEQEGWTQEFVLKRMRELIAAGLAEKKSFRVRWGKHVRSKPHYRLK